MKNSRELKVGLITLIAIASMYYGINFLKGQDLFLNKNIVYAEYKQVDGLSPSRPVNINGLKVGLVDDIYFHPNGSGSLMVAMNITTDFNIPKNTVARISSDLLGNRSVELILGDSPAAISAGDTLASKIQLSLAEEVNEQVKPIKEKAEKLIGSIDTVMILASAFLNEETRNNFRSTFGKLQDVVDRLSNAVKLSEQKIVSSVDDLSLITSTVEENRGELDAIFNNLAALSDSLASINFKQAVSNLDTTLIRANAVLGKIDEGSGSASALVNERELYDNLLQATEQLNLILIDLKYNPKRYVHFSMFGRSPDYDEMENLKLEKEAKSRRDTVSEEGSK
ncbi:MAG: MlaD family protein [Bacteroidetes bacterium]|nr:MlaD family protein [Bacteroidota bacterium]